jgi:hypothetical protein
LTVLVGVELVDGAGGAVEKDFVCAVVVDVVAMSLPAARLIVGVFFALETDKRGRRHQRADTSRVAIAGRGASAAFGVVDWDAADESWLMQSGPIVSVGHCGCEQRVKSGIRARYRGQPGDNNQPHD